jgi:hypothetical protein
MDGLKKFELLQSTLVKTYGAWDAIAEIPIHNGVPYRLPDSREVTGLRRLDYTLGHLRSDPGLQEDISDTTTLIGQKPAPYKEMTPGNYKSYTLINLPDNNGIEEKLKGLFNDVPEITFATLAYGGWKVVIESEHKEYQDFLQTTAQIQNRIPPTNQENVTTLLGIDRQAKQ